MAVVSQDSIGCFPSILGPDTAAVVVAAAAAQLAVSILGLFPCSAARSGYNYYYYNYSNRNNFVFFGKHFFGRNNIAAESVSVQEEDLLAQALELLFLARALSRPVRAP